MTDTLNIDFHVRRLIIKALNSFESKTSAAKALGISNKTLYSKMRDFNILYMKGEYKNGEQLTTHN